MVTRVSASIYTSKETAVFYNCIGSLKSKSSFTVSYWCFWLWNWGYHLPYLSRWHREANYFCIKNIVKQWEKICQTRKRGSIIDFFVQKFHSYLYGRAFTLYTDHKPLTTILNPRKGIPPLSSARLQRWALLLAAYNYNIVCKSTKSHANADGLSHLPLPDDSSAQCLQESSVFNVVQIDTLPWRWVYNVGWSCCNSHNNYIVYTNLCRWSNMVIMVTCSKFNLTLYSHQELKCLHGNYHNDSSPFHYCDGQPVTSHW